jgi:hypothetical protein
MKGFQLTPMVVWYYFIRTFTYTVLFFGFFSLSMIEVTEKVLVGWDNKAL